MIYKKILLFCELSFHFLNGTIFNIKVLNFEVVQLILSLNAFVVAFKKPQPNLRS